MKTKIFTVDRIEEGMLVLEDRESLEITNLENDGKYGEIKQGDILKITYNRCKRIVSVEIDSEAGKKELEKNREKLSGLFDN